MRKLLSKWLRNGIFEKCLDFQDHDDLMTTVNMLESIGHFVLSVVERNVICGKRINAFQNKRNNQQKYADVAPCRYLV